MSVDKQPAHKTAFRVRKDFGSFEKRTPVYQQVTRVVY